MFDQLIGLVLIGLGIKTTLPGSVKGDTISREQFLRSVQSEKARAVEASHEARLQFREKLATIADARKKTIVTNVDAKMTQINTQRTDVWTNQLNNMSQILERIVSRASSAKALGSDTTAVDEAIASAQQAIQAAQDTVTAQAGKQYVVVITTEDALKTSVATTTRTFKQDIASVQQTITQARNVVRLAIQTLNQVASPTP